MEEENFWSLLSLKLTGEAKAEELAALDLLLQKNPDFRLQAQMFVQMWKENKLNEKNTTDFFNRHLQRLSNHPDTASIIPLPALATQPLTEEAIVRPPVMRWLNPRAGIAAAVITLIFLFYRETRLTAAPYPAAQNTVSTHKGSKSNIQLPDGSTAWLNADSKLTFDESFRGDVREVSLEGEAFFDVVKDKTRPFIIHTKTIDIRVLGTAFNVRAYESEKNTETALFRGTVEVTLHNNPDKKIVLKPNEKLMVNNNNLFTTSSASGTETRKAAELRIKVGKVHFEAKDSTAWETLWIKNKLVFDEESLEEVAQKIERWYDVKVVINANDDVKQTSFSAIFDNENLQQVMEALSISGNLTYAINKNIVTIKQ